MTHDWTSARFREALVAMVRRRVPADEVEDVVQSALIEAVSAQRRPEAPDEARRWIWGITRNKIADYHRKVRRGPREEPEPVVAHAPEAERDLLRWAMGELPEGADAAQTMSWLLRESEGEGLDEIASEANLPAPQVRQRVSRLRRLFRARWAQLVAAGLVGLVVALVVRERRMEAERAQRPVVREELGVVIARNLGRSLRTQALQRCAAAQWRPCLEGLDRAQRLDPDGALAPRVREARVQAEEALRPPPPPAPPPARPRGDAGTTQPDGAIVMGDPS